MSWYQHLIPSKIRIDSSEQQRRVPQDLWIKCDHCGTPLYRTDLERNLYVCTKCAHHMRLPARQRLELFLDLEGREEMATELVSKDFLKFRDSMRYKERLNRAQKSSGEKEALLVMRGKVHNTPTVCAAFEFGFMGGSMGSVVGEKFVRAAQLCLRENLPLVCFSASGGARMQESLTSLFQMSKTAAILARMRGQRLPYISVLTDPTMGGVSASLGMLGDIQIAEPGALIGFAGPRVIEQTVRETLPEGFQRSEFLLEHGAIDMLVPRADMRDTIADLIRMMMRLPPRETPRES